MISLGSGNSIQTPFTIIQDGFFAVCVEEGRVAGSGRVAARASVAADWRVVGFRTIALRFCDFSQPVVTSAATPTRASHGNHILRSIGPPTPGRRNPRRDDISAIT